jgi:hypothetical protein
MFTSLLWRGRPAGRMADIFSLKFDVRLQGPLLGWKQTFPRLILSWLSKNEHGPRQQNRFLVWSAQCHILGLYNSGRGRMPLGQLCRLRPCIFLRDCTEI